MAWLILSSTFQQPIIPVMSGCDRFNALNVEWWKRLSLLQIAIIAPFTDKVILVDGQKLIDLASIVAQLYKLENNQCCLCCTMLPSTAVSRFTLLTCLTHALLSLSFYSSSFMCCTV